MSGTRLGRSGESGRNRLVNRAKPGAVSYRYHVGMGDRTARGEHSARCGGRRGRAGDELARHLAGLIAEDEFLDLAGGSSGDLGKDDATGHLVGGQMITAPGAQGGFVGVMA